MPVTGGSENVNGSANATPMGVVMPGIAPIMVPIKTPIPMTRMFSMLRNRLKASRITSMFSSYPKMPSGIAIPAT